MKRIAVTCLLLAGFATAAEAQIELTDYPPCVTVGEWSSPGAIRVLAEKNGVRVSWIPSPEEPFDVEGYEINRAPDLEGPYRPIAIVTNGIREYVDENALPDTFYWYRVRSYRGGLCSPLSEPVRGSR